MNNLLDKINEIVPEANKNRHSYFQIQYFIIFSEPTHQAKIHACKRELISRKNSMEGILMSMEEAYDQKELHEIKIGELRNSIAENSLINETRKTEIEIRQQKRKIQNLEIQIQELKDKLLGYEEEANFIIGLYYQLIEKEPEQDFYSLQNQAEFWNMKLNKELETRMLLGYNPDVEIIKTILNCPNGMPVKNNTIKLIEAATAATQKKKIESSTETK